MHFFQKVPVSFLPSTAATASTLPSPGRRCAAASCGTVRISPRAARSLSGFYQTCEAVGAARLRRRQRYNSSKTRPRMREYQSDLTNDEGLFATFGQRCLRPAGKSIQFEASHLVLRAVALSGMRRKPSRNRAVFIARGTCSDKICC